MRRMELAELTDKAIDYILPECEALADADDRKLTPWEKKEFIPSVSEQWHRKRWLSDKQKEILGRIWDKL